MLLLALTLFMLTVGIWLFDRSRDEVVSALSSLWVAPAVFVFMTLALLHKRHGMQTIIEDYIHHLVMKITLLLLKTAFSIGVAATIFLSLIRIFFLHP